MIGGPLPLTSRVAKLFAPRGILDSRWPRYEDRSGQRALALQIAEAMEHGGVLLAEAPTGLGKSLAYLVPALLVAGEGRRVVVATCTRSLQDQLFERDLPALMEILGLRVSCVLLKGKQNYVCPRRLELMDGEGAEEGEILDRLRAWAVEDPDGDLDRFPASDPHAFRRLRTRVSADATACTIMTCRRGGECHWVRARRQAAQAELVVVNHAPLALSGAVEGLVPDFDVVIVDEAHRLEGVLLAQLERGVSRHRFEEALRVMGSGRRAGAARERGGGGLLARLMGYAVPLLKDDARQTTIDELDRLARRVGQCRAEVEELFSRLDAPGESHPLYGKRERYRSASELLGSDLQPLQGMLEHCASFSRTLLRFAEGFEGERSSAALELSAELEQLGVTWRELGNDLDQVAQAVSPDWVYWRTTSGRGVELHGAPVSVGDHARRLILGRARTAVLTSATLSAAGDFTFVAERLGLGEEWQLPYLTTAHPSPFTLEEQTRTFVYDGGRTEATAVAALVTELAKATRRNQLVLFTAHERLRRARELLAATLPSDHLLLAQEWDGSASFLSERFRRERGAILLGVQSLWEGVDFPGEALEIVVVAKLPFSVPDDPLVEARAERLRNRGLDPFMNDAVPEAVLRFRQGMGRLIRRADDRGVLVVCDPRLIHASYRGPFLASLPHLPLMTRDARELAHEAARFLSGDVPVEDRA